MKGVKLGDICKMQSGGTPSRKNISFYKGGFIPWVKISDIEKAENGIIRNTEEKITKDGLRSINNRVFPKGTLLFAMYGSVGKVAIAGKELSTNQAILGIQPDKDKLDTQYFVYWLKSNLKNFQLQARGVALKNLSATIMKNQNINLPPLETQRKIATILDKANELVQNDKKTLEKYDQLAQSVFLEMFGDPVVNTKGWKKGSTIDYADCIVPGRDKPKSFTGNIPWVTTDDLSYRGKTKRSKKLIGLKQSEINQVRARIIPENSVLMTCVGDLGLISINTHKMVVNQQLHTFQCGPDLNPIFLMYNLSFQTPYMFKMASITTVPYLNKTNCNNTPTIVPPIKLQNHFAEIINHIETQKQLARQSLQKSEELFHSLLQGVFKGDHEN